MSDPDLVADVHYDYIMAGAKIITVNTYSATYTRMAMVDATDKVEFLQKTACELAHRARTRAGSQGAAVAIAGSLPPLNGTYRPDRVRDFDVNLDEYRKLAEVEDSMWYFHALNRRMLLPLAELANKNASILDAGCGTGGLIKALQGVGAPWTIKGLDYSPVAAPMHASELQCQSRRVRLRLFPLAKTNLMRS
jgi:2-polyprenyl-3-methyl-5-hydroxy-6-metoxy-1,4-benzoquinol methylase